MNVTQGPFMGQRAQIALQLASYLSFVGYNKL